MVRCIMLLTLSSILLRALEVVCSILRRTVMLEAAKGIKTVLIHVIIRCMIVMAAYKLGMNERSGSAFAFSWDAANSFALYTSQQFLTVTAYKTHASRAVST